MEEKKELKVKFSTALLIIALIVIIVMGYCIYVLSKANKEKLDKNDTTTNIIEEIQQDENNIENLNDSINTIVPEEDDFEEIDFTGIWTVKKAIRNDNGEQVNLSEVYGSSVAIGCGNLTLNKNNYFVDLIDPNNDGSYTKGNYKINKNVITLTYSDFKQTERELVYNNEDKTVKYSQSDKYSIILEKKSNQISEELYEKDYDELLIRKYDDGSAQCDISMYRLAGFECLDLNYINQNEATFTTLDPSGDNNISGKLEFNKNSVKITITDSVWDYLPIGTTFELEKIK